MKTIKHSPLNWDELYFESMHEWQKACQEMNEIIPVYLWDNKYIVIVTNVTKSGDRGCVALGSTRNAVTNYETPFGVLSHHWKAYYATGNGGYNRKYWTFKCNGKLPNKIKRQGDYWLSGWVATTIPGLYNAVTQDGIPYPATAN